MTALPPNPLYSIIVSPFAKCGRLMILPPSGQAQAGNTPGVTYTSRPDSLQRSCSSHPPGHMHQSQEQLDNFPSRRCSRPARCTPQILPRRERHCHCCRTSKTWGGETHESQMHRAKGGQSSLVSGDADQRILVHVLLIKCSVPKDERRRR